MDFLEQAKGLMPALHERWVFPVRNRQNRACGTWGREIPLP